MAMAGTRHATVHYVAQFGQDHRQTIRATHRLLGGRQAQRLHAHCGEEALDGGDEHVRMALPPHRVARRHQRQLRQLVPEHPHQRRRHRLALSARCVRSLVAKRRNWCAQTKCPTAPLSGARMCNLKGAPKRRPIRPCGQRVCWRRPGLRSAADIVRGWRSAHVDVIVSVVQRTRCATPKSISSLERSRTLWRSRAQCMPV